MKQVSYSVSDLIFNAIRVDAFVVSVLQVSEQIIHLLLTVPTFLNRRVFFFHVLPIFYGNGGISDLAILCLKFS
jgi:hypothetical protein